MISRSPRWMTGRRGRESRPSPQQARGVAAGDGGAAAAVRNRRLDANGADPCERLA